MTDTRIGGSIVVLKIISSTPMTHWMAERFTGYTKVTATSNSFSTARTRVRSVTNMMT